jgi:hypothetical protein
MRAKEFITESHQGLKFSLIDNDGELTVKALSRTGKELAYAIFDIGDDNTLDPQDLQVDERFRGQGIAKTMYDYLTAQGYEIHRSYDQTDAGAAFWQKNRGEDVRIWEGVTSQVLYHGSEQPITKFTIPAYGAFFSPHREWAEHYGSVITPVHVHASKVYLVDYTNDIDEKIIDALFDRDYATLAKFVKLLQSKGYQALQTISDSEMVCVFPGTDIEVVDQSLTELFEPGKDYKWSFTGSEEAVAVFHIGEIPFQFHAYTYPEANGTWDVEFKNAERGRTRYGKFGLTGTGNSAEVMSTVTDIMREFLQRYQGKVTALTFTADEQSRQSLYARMAKRLLPTWQLTQTDKQFILTAPAN